MVQSDLRMHEQVKREVDVQEKMPGPYADFATRSGAMGSKKMAEHLLYKFSASD